MLSGLLCFDLSLKSLLNNPMELCRYEVAANVVYLRFGDGFIRQPVTAVEKCLLPKLSTKADRYSSAGTAAGSRTEDD